MKKTKNIKKKNNKKETGFLGHILLYNLGKPVTDCLINDFLQCGIGVFKAGNPQEVFDILKTGVNVLLTNHIPGSENSVIHLLEHVKKSHPDVHKAVMCADEGLEKVMDLVFQDLVNSYFHNPEGFGNVVGQVIRLLEIAGELETEAAQQIDNVIEMTFVDRSLSTSIWDYGQGG